MQKQTVHEWRVVFDRCEIREKQLVQIREQVNHVRASQGILPLLFLVPVRRVRNLHIQVSSLHHKEEYSVPRELLLLARKEPGATAFNTPQDGENRIRSECSDHRPFRLVSQPGSNCQGQHRGLSNSLRRSLQPT